MPTIFLLGGQDLEMQEISYILDRERIQYFDKKLRWDNANLDAYRTELEKYGNLPNIILYGIELQDNGISVKYKNYFPIDHHNVDQGKEASLLQVMGLLQLSPVWEQLLIAANDAAYIPGMQALGATWAEIQDIRLRDRMAQGITEEEEELAEQAIVENLEKKSDLFVVHALSSRFSPICDRLWPYRKLLIYTEETCCYYGEGKEYLVKVFEREIQQALIYHGGGKNGFLGAICGKWTSEEIWQLKEKILKVIQNI